MNVLVKLTQRFMKIIIYNIFYFASELEIFDPWTALMFLIALWAHFYLLITFQAPLARVRSDDYVREWSSLRFCLGCYLDIISLWVYVPLDYLVFGSYLDIELLNIFFDKFKVEIWRLWKFVSTWFIWACNLFG